MGSNKARKSTHNKTKKVVKATLGKAKVVAIEATVSASYFVFYFK